jgi:hypothetical protein
VPGTGCLFDIGGANYRHGKKTDLKWLLQLLQGDSETIDVMDRLDRPR